MDRIVEIMRSLHNVVPSRTIGDTRGQIQHSPKEFEIITNSLSADAKLVVSNDHLCLIG